MARSASPLSAAELLEFFRRLKLTAEAAAESQRLRSIIEQLASVVKGGPVSRGRGRPVATGKARRRTRKPGITPDTLLPALTSAKDGISVGELAAKVGQAKPRVAMALKKLRDAKKAKLKGEKRLARWFAA